MSAYRPHVMVDLEALSLRKDAAIIQVAALVFDPLTGERGTQFNAFVSGLEGHVRPDTVAWWMQQPAARRVGAGMAGGHCIAHVLQSFTLWLQGVAGPELQDLAG